MANLIEFTTAELLEIEQALEPAVSDTPEFQAAIDSAFFKVGLALKRHWALKQEEAAIKSAAERLSEKMKDVRQKIDSMTLDQWVGWVDALAPDERLEFSRKNHSNTAFYHVARQRPKTDPKQ